MSFHFKQALEYLQTPDGKVEDFLRSTINAIKNNHINLYTDIDEFHFILCEYLAEDRTWFYEVMVQYPDKKRDGNLEILYSCRLLSLGNALPLINGIENQLKSEGFNCEPVYLSKINYKKYFIARLR